jgi:hypothetical protein
VIILQCQKVENNYQRAETSLVLIVHYGVFCNAFIQVVVTGFFLPSLYMNHRGGFRGGRAGRAPPPPKIRKAYVIQR